VTVVSKAIRASKLALADLARRLGRIICREPGPSVVTLVDFGEGGHERLIDRILVTIRNNSILLIGGPGSGKTSILLRLNGLLAARVDADPRFYPVYVDLHGVPEHLLFATVGDAVLGQLAFSPPSKVARLGSAYGDRDLANDIRAVVRTLEESSSRPVATVVLLVDGIDELNRYHPRTTQRVRSLFMGGLAENLVMVAAAVAIDKDWEREGSPWYNFFEEIEIPQTGSEAGVRDRMPRDG
jgi:hypothetical protein